MGEVAAPIPETQEIGDPPGVADEQRATARYTPLIRTAKLVCPEGEFLCVVRNASVAGLSVRAFHQLPAHSSVTLELQNGDRHKLEQVWDEGERLGYRFLDEVDIERLLAARGEHPKRPIRLRIELEGQVACIGGKFDVKVQNLSQQGASVVCERMLAIGQRLKLTGRYLPEIRANVRWRDGKSYGLVFDDTFQFAELARICARAQRIDTFFDA